MIQDYGLIKVKLSDLEFDKENPNELTKEQQESLKKSFRKFGNVMPILIDQNNFIVHGNHRAEIYQQLGLDEIPAFRREFKDDDERRLCSQAMNKLHGQYETLKDSNQLLLLFQNQKLDELTELIAQPKEELQRIIQKGHPEMQFYQEDNFDVDKALEEIVPQTQLGDIWELGNHRLMCADCSDEKSIKRLMGEQKAILCLTDPPYSVDYDDRQRRADSKSHKDLRDTYEDKQDAGQLLSSLFEITPADLLIMTYPVDKHFQELAKASALWNLLYELVWIKQHFTYGIGKRYKQQHEPILIFRRKNSNDAVFNVPDNKSTLFEYDREMANPLHPTPRPIGLLIELIQYHSNERDLIIDPFLGSGSTLIACEQTERVCYGVEIDPHYCDVIVKRWEEFTNRKAKLLRST